MSSHNSTLVLLILCLSAVLVGCGDSETPDAAVTTAEPQQSSLDRKTTQKEQATQLVERAIEEIRHQKFEDAIASLNQAIETDQENAEASFQRAGILADVGQDQLALNDYSRAVELNPNDVRYRNMRGLFLLTRSQLEPALADFAEAVRIDPKYIQAWNNRGLVRLATGDFQTAIDDFNKACEIDPTYADGFNNRGFAWFKMDDYDRARADFDKTLELKPEYVNAWNNRGMLNMRLQKHREAIDDFSHAIRYDENNVKHYQNRMNAYRELGMESNALADGERIAWLVKLGQLNSVVAQTPEQPDGYIQRASHLAEAGQHEIALANFEQAIQVGPGKATPWASRARYWLQRGDTTKAIADATRAIENEFSHPALSIRGDAWLQLGDFDKAIADYTAAKRLDPAVAQAYYRRALNRREQGNEAGFQADLETARQLDPQIGQ
ncbi:MAG: tetratricopeptide repeat protein [Planctomycetota bacterium]|nr:tetratricopeptide repeat protein [Planctomycetota bacterium]